MLADNVFVAGNSALVNCERMILVETLEIALPAVVLSLRLVVAVFCCVRWHYTAAKFCLSGLVYNTSTPVCASPTLL